VADPVHVTAMDLCRSGVAAHTDPAVHDVAERERGRTMDDSFCLFVIVASMLTFAMPAAAQTTFALVAAVLVVAARFAPAKRAGRSEAGSHRGAIG
jgi:hypothetical protein